MYPPRFFFLWPCRIRVNLLSYNSKPTEIQDQYDWIAEKHLDGYRGPDVAYRRESVSLFAKIRSVWSDVPVWWTHYSTSDASSPTNPASLIRGPLEALKICMIKAITPVSKHIVCTYVCIETALCGVPIDLGKGPSRGPMSQPVGGWTWVPLVPHHACWLVLTQTALSVANITLDSYGWTV